MARQLLDDLTARGMAKPDLVVVDGGPVGCADIPPGDRAERNLLAPAPKQLHEEF